MRHRRPDEARMEDPRRTLVVDERAATHDEGGVLDSDDRITQDRPTHGDSPRLTPDPSWQPRTHEHGLGGRRWCPRSPRPPLRPSDGARPCLARPAPRWGNPPRMRHIANARQPIAADLNVPVGRSRLGLHQARRGGHHWHGGQGARLGPGLARRDRPPSLQMRVVGRGWSLPQRHEYFDGGPKRSRPTLDGTPPTGHAPWQPQVTNAPTPGGMGWAAWSLSGAGPPCGPVLLDIVVAIERGDAARS